MIEFYKMKKETREWLFTYVSFVVMSIALCWVT